MEKKCVIFAPHVDDEMIGCWSLLTSFQVSEVCYFFELTSERRTEAQYVANSYGFKATFVDESEHEKLKFPVGTTILVPNINDNHVDHKYINRLAKTCYAQNYDIEYYSVDMNTKHVVLSNEQRKLKENDLKRFYLSQLPLFANEKYFLFESIVKDDSNKMIWVKFQHEGIHRYEAALTDPNLADVKFLGHDHRHIFHFKVAIEVFHDDRDIEFIQFKRWLMDLYNGALEFDHQSCEMLADNLSKKIQRKYPGRKLIIDVSEDDENGVTVEYL